MEINNLFDGVFKNRRVLITGHTGFKGSWLSILLSKAGAKVYGYALKPHTNPSLFVEAGVSNIVESYIGDIRDYNNLLSVFQKVKPEIVFHMAAQAIVLESYRNPSETFSVNIIGTVNLLETIRKISGVKAVVVVTSDKCYENREMDHGYKEEEAMGGYDPYSGSKGCAELVTSSYRNSFFNTSNYSEHGVAIATARAGNVIGGGDWSRDRLIPDFIRSITSGQTLKIRNPNAVRPWQYVLEPLTGYLILARKLFTEGPGFSQAWNFGPADEDAKNVEWITRTICEMWGDNAAYNVEITNEMHEAGYLKLDCSKAKEKLNWSPRWNIYKALEATVGWNKEWLRSGDARKICMQQINEYYNI